MRKKKYASARSAPHAARHTALQKSAGAKQLMLRRRGYCRHVKRLCQVVSKEEKKNKTWVREKKTWRTRLWRALSTVGASRGEAALARSLSILYVET